LRVVNVDHIVDMNNNLVALDRFETLAGVTLRLEFECMPHGSLTGAVST